MLLGLPGYIRRTLGVVPDEVPDHGGQGELAEPRPPVPGDVGATWSLRFTGLGRGLPAFSSGIFLPQSTCETLCQIHLAAARTCRFSDLESRR